MPYWTAQQTQRKRPMVSAKLIWVHGCANVDYAGNCWENGVKHNELPLHYPLFNLYHFLGVNSKSLEYSLFSLSNNSNNNNHNDKETTKQLNGWDIDADACIKCAIVLRPVIVYVRKKACWTRSKENFFCDCYSVLFLRSKENTKKSEWSRFHAIVHGIWAL